MSTLLVLSSTYFPLEQPVLVALNGINPLYHLAQCFRGILIGGPVWAIWPPCSGSRWCCSGRWCR